MDEVGKVENEIEKLKWKTCLAAKLLHGTDHGLQRRQVHQFPALPFMTAGTSGADADEAQTRLSQDA